MGCALVAADERDYLSKIFHFDFLIAVKVQMVSDLY